MHKQLEAGLAEFGLSLSERSIDRELKYLDELLRWNERINLTSICIPGEAVEKHLLDSLILLNYLEADVRLLDMGSGGGLPGIPLAIASEGIRVTSVDSVGKKISFQKHIKRMLQLNNFFPVKGRLEEVELNEPFDCIVARALSDIGVLVRLAEARLRSGGRLLIMKGPEGEAELKQYLESRNEKNLFPETVFRYQLPESGSARQLIILTKR